MLAGHWELAKKALASADRVVSAGYRFPGRRRPHHSGWRASASLADAIDALPAALHSVYSTQK